MEVGREERHLRQRRFAAFFGITGQSPLQERMQAPLRLRRAAAKACHRRDRPIDVQPGDQHANIRQRDRIRVGVALRRRGSGLADRDRCGAQRLQPGIAQACDLRPQRARRNLALVRREVHRHHRIAFDLYDATAAGLRDTRAPCLLVPQVAAIADDQRGTPREIDRDGVGHAAADDERDASRCKRRIDLAQSLQHECVMTCVRLGIAVGEPEAHDHRQPEPVGIRDRPFQRRIEIRALRLLHPVEHVLARNFGCVVQELQALALDHRW